MQFNFVCPYQYHYRYHYHYHYQYHYSLPSTSPTSSNSSNTDISTLPNGLIVVTEDASSTSTVSLTFPSAGSSSETASEAGAALANKCLAFKSGSGLSSALILRTLEQDGASSFSKAGRSGASAGFTCAPDKVQRLIPLLATECSFEKWDVRDAQKTAAVIVQESMANAQVSSNMYLPQVYI